MPTNRSEPRSSLTENVGAQARETLNRGRKQAEKAKNSAGKALANSRQTAGRLYDDAKDRSYRLADTTNRLVQEHPLASAAIAVAAGAAIAALFPRVRAAAIAPIKDLTQRAIAAIDTEAMKDKAEDLVEEAKSVAHDASAQGGVLRDRAAKILAEASKAVANRVDAEALRTHAFEAAAKAGELAGDMLHKASKAVSEAAKKSRS